MIKCNKIFLKIILTTLEKITKLFLRLLMFEIPLKVVLSYKEK